MTTIYLIRHAAYENPKQIFHGRLPGFPLSKNGHKQAGHLARRLAHIPIAAVYTSPLTRAFQTAEIIAQLHDLPVRTDARLLDIRSPLQNRPYAYMDAINWNFYRPEFIRQGGERLSEIFTRIDALIREVVVKHEGQHIVLVSHSDPIMVIKVKYLGGPIRSRRIFNDDYVPTAGGYCITFNSSRTVSSIEQITR